MAKVYREDEEYTKDHFCHGLDKGSSLCKCFNETGQAHLVYIKYANGSSSP
jgi:hypothetical protein